MKKFLALSLLLTSTSPIHLNAALVRIPRSSINGTVRSTASMEQSLALPPAPRSSTKGTLHATSAMERSLASHFDATEGKTPDEKKLEERYRAIVADAVRPDAVRRRELFEILEGLHGRIVAPRQNDLVRVNPEEAPRFLDDGDRARLCTAVDRAITNVKRQAHIEALPFGERFVKRTDLLATLEDFRSLLNWNLSREQLDGVVRARFDIYRSPGKYGTGGVLYTAYNDPVFEGSLTRTATYRFPLYRQPELAKLPSARFDRAEVNRGALAGKGLELAWFKSPVEPYMFELEGSGLVKLPDGGMLRLRYASDNGRQFHGLGSQVEKDGLFQTAAEARASGRTLYLTRPDLALAELAKNPRVIYFEGERVAPTVSDLDLLPGRSVAVDTEYFPRGGLGFMWLDQPEFTEANTKPSTYAPVSRFALNHDTGNAIRGPGRIDIYWGHDELAQLAGRQLRQPGSLFYLLRQGTGLLATRPAVAPMVARPVRKPSPVAARTGKAKVPGVRGVPRVTIVVRKDPPRKPAKLVRSAEVADARLARPGTPARRGPSRGTVGPSRRRGGSTRRPKDS